MDSGEYNITALYMGSTTHEPSIDNITFVYSKNDSIILIEVENITTNQKEIINISVNGKYDKNLIVYVNNDKYYVNNGILTLTSLKEGIYYLSVFWDGDDDYNGQSNSTIFRVINDFDYYINVTSIKSNNKCINLTAKSNINEYVVGGRLFFVLENHTEIEAEFSDGIWWTTYTFLKNGDYYVNARYDALDDVIIQ